MQVIDVPSSPEPSGSSMARRTRSACSQPGPPRKRARLGQLAREPPVTEVIELTDSDDDVLPASCPSQPRPAMDQDVALAFGRPNSQILADAGPSYHVARHVQQGDGVPLFLPQSDDEQRMAHSPSTLVAQDVPDAAPAHPQPAPESAAPQAPPLADSIDEHFVRVLEIVPDVQPAHALELIEQFMHAQPENVVEFVLHALFENPSYPKADKKGKHKRDESNDDTNARDSSKPKIDYASKDRINNCGPHYFECSLEQLVVDFPRIPKPHIRSRLFVNQFYAPTYLLLAEELKKQPPPFKLKTTNSVVSKGKIRQDPEFDKERQWISLKVAELATEGDAALAAAVNEQEYEDNGEGIECGCCFSMYPFDQMIQCPEAHLFCKSCMSSYASNLLGEHNPNIVCMDQSGCKLAFPESELGRFLSAKLLELYYRVKQQKEIEAAGLENLEECPFCEYKCVIDNETEKLFRCENVECNAITCRACKKPDHLPKTCKEVEEDKHLDAQHVIEEAMTQALMRNCPKCQKSFIKEMGCNKMTCPSCHTMSCYICRKIIVGYDHFSNPPPYTGKTDKAKCNLWDPVEQRHAEEVSEAAKHALAELRKSRPDVDESNLKVDIPVARIPTQPGAAKPNGGVALPGYIAGDPARMAALAAQMGMGMDARMGAAAVNPFMLGANQAHQFAAPAVEPWMGPPALARGAAIPEPAIPLALARGRRVRAQPVVAAGVGGGQQRKGR